MESEKLIQDFLSGQLDQEGQQKLAALVEKDADFASQLEIESAVYGKRLSDLKTELRKANIDRPSLNQSETSSKPRSTRIIKFITSIAAMSLISIAAYLLFSQGGKSSNQELLAQQFLNQKHTAPVTLMGGAEGDVLWSNAIELYKSSQYQNVINTIDHFENKTDEQILYLGICKLYLETPDVKGAISDLENITSKPSSLVNDQANWFLALSYLAQKNANKAKPILEKIVSTHSWKHENAKHLLKEL